MKHRTNRWILIVIIAASVLLTSCGNSKGTPDKQTDAVTSASLVSDEAAFLKASGKDGTWIIAVLEDITMENEVVLEGEFFNRDLPARKIALYAQDSDRNITARYKLTAPKLTVRSENATIQGGTFMGDIYVEAKGFSVIDATIEGNVYFADEEMKASFTLGEGGKVTGTTEIKK